MHVHAHAAVVNQFGNLCVDARWLVAHGIVVVGGVAVVRRLNAVVLVRVGIAADAGFREAEIVEKLRHGGGYTTGHHSSVNS